MLKRSMSLIGTTLSFVLAITLTSAPFASATENSVAPGPPTSLQLVSKTANSLTVSWVAPANDGGTPLTDYIVEYSVDGKNWTVFDDGISTTTSATITGLTRGVSYQVRVKAVNQEGSGLAINLSSRTSVYALSAGKSHTCAILSDGTVKCWGYNGNGELGDGRFEDRTVPVNVYGITQDNPAVSISASYHHTCAILSDGTVKCWGHQAHGELGDGTVTSRAFPVSVSGITSANPAVSISVGTMFSCAILTDGTVKCWGLNDYGQLGIGNGPGASHFPVSVSGITSANPAVSVSAGANHTCAILSDGTVKCWGRNGNGQLGDGTFEDRTVPVNVYGITQDNPAVSISAGWRRTCAILSDGTVKCWGHNWNGQLGDGTAIDRTVPVSVYGISSANPAISISVGYLHTCAILSDRTLKCWGFNLSGQLGDGTTGYRTFPVSVTGASPTVSISAAERHTCSVLWDGTVKCWGLNDYGQLGDETTVDRSLPVSVTGVVAFTLLARNSVPADIPGAPRSLISTAKTAGSVSLSWTAPADDGGLPIMDYLIQYSSNSGSNWTTFTEHTSINNSAIVTGLTRGISYIFRVAAANPEGTGNFSNSSSGVIPDVVPNAPTSLALVSKSTNSISLSWRAPIENGGTAVADYKVEYSTDGSNWSTFSDGVSTATSATITGLIRGTSYQVRVKAVNQEGLGEEALLTSLIPATAPTRPLGLLVTGHSNSTVDLNWSTPTDNGGLPLISYGIWYSTNSGQTWTLNENTNGLVNAVTVESLTRGTSYVFRVAASNEDGYGEFSDNSTSVIPAELPGVPTSPKLVTRGTSSVAISWTAPSDSGGRGITGYKVRLSSDQGLTWGNPLLSTGNGTAFTIPNIPIASARLVQLAAVTAEGTGEWSDALYVTTKGARAMSVKLLDAASKPISGGQVTWRMVDNSAWSSKVYGLTADGLIEFPYAPAGLVNVTLKNGVLADGTLVSGTWQTVIGYSSTTLKTPRLDLLSKRLVRTVIPGGLPVANVAVTVNDDEVTKKVTVSGFTFETDTLRTSGVTDPNGDFLVVGYWNETPTANLIYDDGVITQQQNVELAEATTRVELDYMPWVTFDSSAVTGTEGAQTNIAISVKDIDGESMSSLSNESPQAVASSKVVSIPKSGVTVRLIAPAGATGKCTVKGKKEKLSGISGTNGKVTLTICPSVSGEYKLSTSGGAPIGKVLLRVNGAPSLPVTAVSVSSPAIGKARISWNPPSFLGGAPITSYTVVAKATGKTTVTKVVTSSTRLVTLTGLANGTTYTISITAKTKNGTSIAVVKKLPVA